MIASYENVCAAVAALIERGERISIATVIRQLGGGSRSDIGPLLKRYRQEQPDPGGEEAKIPAHVAAEAQLAIGKLYALAKTDARVEFEQDRGYQASVTAGLREDLDESEAEVATLKVLLDEIQPRLEDVVRRNEDLMARCSAAEASLVDERVGHVQTKCELDQARQSIASLKSQLDNASTLALEVSSLRAVVTDLAKTAKKPAAGRGRKPGRPRKVQQGTAELAPT